MTAGAEQTLATYQPHRQQGVGMMLSWVDRLARSEAAGCLALGMHQDRRPHLDLLGCAGWTTTSLEVCGTTTGQADVTEEAQH